MYTKTFSLSDKLGGYGCGEQQITRHNPNLHAKRFQFKYSCVAKFRVYGVGKSPGVLDLFLILYNHEPDVSTIHTFLIMRKSYFAHTQTQEHFSTLIHAYFRTCQCNVTHKEIFGCTLCTYTKMFACL